jgi:hypothetical protein
VCDKYRADAGFEEHQPFVSDERGRADGNDEQQQNENGWTAVDTAEQRAEAEPGSVWVCGHKSGNNRHKGGIWRCRGELELSSAGVEVSFEIHGEIHGKRGFWVFVSLA